MEESETREKILEGSEALFMKYGIRSVTMDDIARHLSVSKKTLYQHFADKDDLVYKMSEMYLDRSSCKYEDIAKSSKNSIEELSKISIRMKSDLENLNPSMLFDLQKYHPKSWGLYTDHKVKTISQSVVRNIRKGVEDGFYRPEINPDILAITRLILIEAAFSSDLFPKDRFNFIEVQTQLFDFFVHGLCTEKGKKLYQKYKEDHHQLSI